MPSLGPFELITVAVIALVVFGPDKLPEFARNVGQFLAQMRRISDDLRSEFSSGMSDFDVEDEPEEDEEEGSSNPSEPHPQRAQDQP
jgi:sec-independent protein translocase protein TatB